MPWFVVEFRPFQYVLFVLVVGLLRSAANGDWQALVILSVCVLLLWWGPLLDAVRQVQEAMHQAGVIAGWLWGRLVRW
jgi:hypothetical protein